MKKHLSCIGIIFAFILSMPFAARSADNDFQEKVWQAMESLKKRKPVNKEQSIDIDTKKVRFPHKKHQKLIKQLGKSCTVCHHRKKKGRPPRACRKCHAKQTIISRGKYTRAGKLLKQNDIFHLLCRDCHKKMLQEGYQRPDGSMGQIPSKCHHCHLKKD